jgi:hypothetical protein
MAGVSLWLSVSGHDVLHFVFDRPGAAFGFLGLLAGGLIVSAVRRTIEHRRSKKGSQLPGPGLFAISLMVVQLACLVALCILGSAALLSLLAGSAMHAQVFQAFLLVLVGSGILFMAGALIRDAAALIPSRWH